MADYNTLTLQQKVQAALPGALQEANVKNPPTTIQDRDNLNREIGALDVQIQDLKDLGAELGNSLGLGPLAALNYPISTSQFPELQTELKKFVPPGYTVSTITLQTVIDVANGVKTEFATMASGITTGGAPQIATGNISPTTIPTRIIQSPTPTANPYNTRTESSTGKILKEAATVAAVAGAASVISDLLRPPKSKKEVSEDPAAAALEAKNKAIAEAEARGPDTLKNTNAGLPGQVKNTRAQATLQDTTNFNQRKDWRVRLALSPGAQQAKYLYYSDTPGILAPLQATDGIIFPYTPSINVTYGATYNSVIPAHSNYKIFQYESSFVDSINITCDFTAQDTDEANYVLAVIHFFRSVTKMFYGQDQFPKPGTPPPLCYLFGMGEFQFNAHPLAVTNFTYNLPTDVDYIRAGAITANAGVSRAPEANTKKTNSSKFGNTIAQTLAQNAVKKIGGVAGGILSKLIPGGTLAGPNFNGSQNSTGFNSTVPPGTKDPTYVPTKISISISAVPIVSRYDISNRFSLQDYASGKLLNGTKQAGGGIW